MSLPPMGASLTAGALWGTVAAVLVLALCVFVIWAARRFLDDIDMPGFIVGCAVLGIVGTLIVWTWAMWPLKYDYHHWVEKSGRVEKISNRLVSGGEGVVNQRFVVVLHGQPYGIDDTRAALLHVGDLVHLRCKKEHQFFQPYAADGWACRWGA